MDRENLRDLKVREIAAKDEELHALVTGLERSCENATPEQFRNRLEISTIIYAVVGKRFKERFPDEYAQWEAEKNQALSEADNGSA